MISDEFNISEGENFVVHVGSVTLEKYQGARDTRYRLKILKKHLSHRYWEKKEELIKCAATPGVMKEFGNYLKPYTKLIVAGEMRLHSYIDESTGEIHSSEILYIKSVSPYLK